MQAFAIFLMVVAMIMTVGILFAGIFSMTKGGEFNNRWGNKLMRMRVIMQMVAIALFAIAMFMLKKG